MKVFFPIFSAVLLPLLFGLPTVAQTGSGVIAIPTAAASATASPDLLAQALEAYEAGKFNTAIEKYQGVIAQDSKSGEGYAGLARTYLKQQKVQLAYESASKGVEQVPDSVVVHVALGEVYYRQAKMAECEKEFLKGVNTLHPNARAYLGLVRLYEAYSMYGSARKMLEKAHTLDPHDPEIQRRWINTLPFAERIKWIQGYLAGPYNEDEDSRNDLSSELDLLKEREQQPNTKCRLVSNVTSTETPLKLMLSDATHFHGYGLEVKFNGKSSRLLLDTGASGLLISRKLAEKAGIQSFMFSHIGGIGDKGEIGSSIGYAKSIKIGELEFENCLVEVSEKRSIVDDDGLIGADVFDHYLVSIDFESQKLKLEELPKGPGESTAAATLSASKDNADESDEASTPQATATPDAARQGPSQSQQARKGPYDRYIAPGMESYTKIFRIGHALLIPTRVSDHPAKLFLIDTGSVLSMISPEAAREVTKIRGTDEIKIRGINGAVNKVYTADKAVLQFSHFRQENQDLTSIDLSGVSRNIGTEVSGLLGFATLKRFKLFKID